MQNHPTIDNSFEHFYTDEYIRQVRVIFMSNEELLNAVQAAAYLGVERQRVYALAKQGRLGQQLAGFWVFTPAELDRFRSGVDERPKGGRPKSPTSRRALAEARRKARLTETGQG